MKEVSFDKKYFIETYGCQMNESDTERISGQLEELGYVPADILDDADVVILNTCSIRQNAEEKVYGNCRGERLRKIHTASSAWRC